MQLPNVTVTQVYNKWKNTRNRYKYYEQNSSQVRKLSKPVGYDVLKSFLYEEIKTLMDKVSFYLTVIQNFI